MGTISLITPFKVFPQRRNMANAKHVPDPGTIGRPGHGRHRHIASPVLHLCRLGRVVRVDVAYRINGAESLHLGLPRELHPAAPAHLAEFHLECGAV